MAREKQRKIKQAQKEVERKKTRREKHKEKQRKLEIKNSIKHVMKNRMHLLAMVVSHKELDIKNGNTPTKLKVPLSQLGVWEGLIQSDGKVQGLELSSWDIEDKDVIELDG
ncbi:MAG: hypothetical protein ACRCXT_07155, partial [Paraclostridium sp.]